MYEAIDGIRVLELGQVIAGPFCGQLLGDLGAEVIKVEPPGVGDVLRQWGHRPGGGDSLWWRVTGRNKRSVTVDLRRPEGQELVRGLAAKTDIVVENFRPGTMERWGLGWPELSAANPGLIMVRISGFGQDGPYASRAGYAAIGEAMGGAAGADRVSGPAAGAGRGEHRGLADRDVRRPGRAGGIAGTVSHRPRAGGGREHL